MAQSRWPWKRNSSSWIPLPQPILREESEKAFGILIPDGDWLAAGTISDLVGVIDRMVAPGTAGFAGHTGTPDVLSQGIPTWNSDDMAETMEIGMPPSSDQAQPL